VIISDAVERRVVRRSGLAELALLAGVTMVVVRLGGSDRSAQSGRAVQT
jgi:hypothetical protein